MFYPSSSRSCGTWTCSEGALGDLKATAVSANPASSVPSRCACVSVVEGGSVCMWLRVGVCD